ncbi:MAG: putative molybdopterin oxidoreductase, partial [Ilumatobacteraceae bacterium]|nr:putative molybdopterin oxidoreductase [Ilumatobacteraceae bacterium]
MTLLGTRSSVRLVVMTALIPTIEVRHTTCTLDCPDACSLAVTVTDGRITGIDAGPGNPLTDQWICAKVKRHANRVYAPERVMTPLIRTAPKGAAEFRPATWDEALDLIAGRMRAGIATAGSDSIVAFTYNSSAPASESNGLTEAFFAAIGAAQVEHTICAATVSAAWESVYGDMLSADPLDVVDAQIVVVWGANPTVSNTHFPPLVQQAVDRGAKLVVVDPRRTAMANRADLHLAIRPGTDVVLAMAVANWWRSNGLIDQPFVDEHTDGAEPFLAEAAQWTVESAAQVCGLDADDIVQFARWYGTTRPAMLRIGWGQERNSNGGAACRAILALPALAGHFGVRGGGVIGSTSDGTPVRARRRWPQFDGPPRRALNLHQVGAWLAPDAGDPCQVLFVQGSNPLVMCPDQHAVATAFQRDDIFTVVHEQVMTDTARYADVVLPATTAFEIDDVAVSYGSYTVQPVRAVIDRVGQSRSNDELGLALANRMGLSWAVPTATVVDDAGPRVLTVGTLQFVDTAPPTGRVQLLDPVQGAPRYRPIQSSHPLTLISPASSKLINSMFGEFQSPSPAVLVHPDDAAARGLSAGQVVRVFNEQGSIEVALEVHDATRPGVVVMSKGVWLRNHHDGWGVNALTPATADALVDGACFNDT